MEDDLATGPSGVGDQSVPVVEALLSGDPGAESDEVLRDGTDVGVVEVATTSAGISPVTIRQKRHSVMRSTLATVHQPGRCAGRHPDVVGLVAVTADSASTGIGRDAPRPPDPRGSGNSQVPPETSVKDTPLERF